jgi:hypothetical protein
MASLAVFLTVGNKILYEVLGRRIGEVVVGRGLLHQKIDPGGGILEGAM